MPDDENIGERARCEVCGSKIGRGDGTMIGDMTDMVVAVANGESPPASVKLVHDNCDVTDPGSNQKIERFC